MKDEEKNLIENLFHRLKKTELSTSERDNEADLLIQNLVKKQPHASYYMIQTILIQETAIKKMNATIEELKNKLLHLQNSKTKTSFLSNLFKKDSLNPKVSHDVWKKNSNRTEAYNTANIPTSPTVTANNNTGFLRNALQTATGVAGGMILGNMLMNVFNHTKPEDEIFDTINESSVSDFNEFHAQDTLNSNFVDYDEQNNEVNYIQSSSDIDNIDDIDDTNDSDFNDDNLV